MVLKRFLILLSGLLLLLFHPLLAQNEGAIWYFGQHAGLDFNGQDPVALTDGQINTREGVASISDKNGKLLFYTDGQTVFNSSHEVMKNGEGLWGDISSTQSSIVVPRPGSTTQFYLFTVDQAGTRADPGKGLNYSIVDMSLDDGDGAVIEKNSPMPGVANVLFTEKIAVVKHNDPKTNWIIAHEFGTNLFYEFLLTDLHVIYKDAVAAGSVHSINPKDLSNRGATGYLKSSPKGEFLATAVEGLHFFELFTFDNKNGDIKLLATLPAGDGSDPSAFTGAAYGVEFSPTANFLYGSTRKDGYIYQWDLESLDGPLIRNSVRIIRGKSNILCGALQLGPNGKIYVCLSGQPYLGVIKSPIQKECNYDEHGTVLVDNSGTGEGGKAYFGLPTFLSDFFKAAYFYFNNTCENEETIFYLAANRITITGLPSWKIYDANSVPIGKATIDPVTLQGTYRFPGPGKYLAELNVIQFGGPIQQIQEVIINPLPELNLPDTTAMCKGSPARLDAGDGAFYSWKDAPNLTVERYRDIYFPGEYQVTVTHYNGCSNSDMTRVVEKPVPIIKKTEISPAACGSSNGSITIEMEKVVDRYTFAWTDFPDSTNRISKVPGGVYEVKITEDSTGCSITRKLSISEMDAPPVSIKASGPLTVCAGSKVTLIADGAANYLWETPANYFVNSVDVYPWETTTYRVEGYSIDQNGQRCSGFDEITITVRPYNLPQLGNYHEKCQGDTLTLDGGEDYETWQWSTGESTQLVQITQSDPELIVFVTDQNQCIFSDTTKVNIKPLPVISLAKDIIQCQGQPVELFGGTGDSYLWNTGDTTQQIFVTESDVYKLTIQTSGCTNTDSVNVTIKPLPEVDLGNDITLCLNDPYRLNGDRGDSWLWSTGETTQDINTSQSGSYWLEITRDGCSNRDTIDLIIKPLPKVDLGRDTTYCKSNPIPLSGGPGGSFLWSTGATTPEILINETGMYSLTITTDGCKNTDDVMIRMNDPALLGIDRVDTFPVTCPGKRDGSLIILKHGSGIDYEYSIDGGSSWFDSPVFQGLYGDNSFQIVVREDKACTATYPKEIIFKEPDSIHINYRLVSPSCEVCPDGEINLTIQGGTPPYSILWSTNDTIAFLANRVLGKYLVWVTDDNKCRETALIDLTMGYQPFQVPNAFTPNGDGYNETWEIPLKDFPACEVKIFNSAGKLIWWSDPGYPVQWDGKDQSGKVLPMGAYYYLIWLRSDLKPIKGSVSILK